ncbi:Microtubule-associated protein 2, partial [Dufourea novaeangliae]
VKSNPTLSPGIRARPQGPPGSPRHLISNGPIGQPRPEGFPQQIRFDSSAPLRPSWFPKSTNHIKFTFSGNFSKFGHQNVPQQTKHPDVFARFEEIPRKQSQQNESLLKKEEKKPILPRIVIERMADVDNTKKLQQVENSLPKEKMREYAENDDDDDVVMDGKKSPHADASRGKESIESKLPNKGNILQSIKRPEIATLNGKVSTNYGIAGKLNEQINNTAADHKAEKSESQAVESIKYTGTTRPVNCAGSVKLNDRTHTDGAGKQEKADDKLKESVEKVVENKNITDKADSNEKCIMKSTRTQKDRISSTAPAVRDHEGNKSDKESLNKQKELSVKCPDGSRASTPTEASQNQKDQELKTPSKSLDRSREVSPREMNQHKTKDEQKVQDKSPNKSRTSTPTETNENQNEQESRVPSKSLDKSRATPTETNENQNEQESRVPSKSLDKSRACTSVGANEGQKKEELKAQNETPTKLSKNSNEEKLKLRQSPLEEVNVDKRKHESKVIGKELDESHENISTIVEPNQVPESKESSQTCKQSSEEKGLENSAKSISTAEKTSVEESTKSVKNDEKDIKVISDDFEKPAINTLEPKIISSNTSLPTSAKKIDRSSKSPASSASPEKLTTAESTFSSPRSPEDSIKGFDNGQMRSLSVKSSPLLSPQSPVSPKSPTDNAKSVSHEKKKTTFVESSIDKEVDYEKKTPDSKTPWKSSTPRIQRAPTPAKLDEKSERKTTTTMTTGIENGNATDEYSQHNTIPATNGVVDSPTKSPSISKNTDKGSTAGSPVKSPNKSIKSLPRTPETPSSTAGQEKKKLPMNKVQVGAAPSPNLKTVRSKIGSLENASYKPGGGKVKIENRKLDFSKAQPKIAAKNEKYAPSGGDKKIAQVKLQWNAKSKIGSLENATYKPGGGDKKIETVKLDFKNKAKPKVGSKDNAKHVPGGGSIKIQTQKVEIKAESKIGSLDNVKHKPGGGEKKIFDDRDYLRQTGSNVESLSGSGSQIANIEEEKNFLNELLKENLPQPPPTTPIKIRKLPSPTSIVTPKAVRSSFAKSSKATGSKNNLSSKETDEMAKDSPDLEDSKAITKDKLKNSPSPIETNPPSKSSDKSSPSHT